MIEHFEDTLHVVTECVRTLDEDAFRRLEQDCMDTLDAGCKVIATGLGKNVPICEKFVGSLTCLGMSAAFMHTNTAVHGDLGLVQPGDLVIVLTKSGETAESIYLVDLLKERNCKLWLLTFGPGSTLCHRMDDCLVLRLLHEGDPWDIVPNNSTLLYLLVLQELAMGLAARRDISMDTLRLNHPGGNIGALLRGADE